jgi:hypothetical protein
MAQKNYIGRVNRNGTTVTRATHDRLADDYSAAIEERRQRRAFRWLRANLDKHIGNAPRHIRWNVGR